MFSAEASWSEIQQRVTGHDLKRLQSYASNLADHHLITDLMPSLAYLFFNNKLPLIKFNGYDQVVSNVVRI